MSVEPNRFRRIGTRVVDEAARRLHVALDHDHRERLIASACERLAAGESEVILAASIARNLRGRRGAA